MVLEAGDVVDELASFGVLAACRSSTPLLGGSPGFV